LSQMTGNFNNAIPSHFACLASSARHMPFVHFLLQTPKSHLLCVLIKRLRYRVRQAS
jgi:hypothetical protein